MTFADSNGDGKHYWVFRSIYYNPKIAYQMGHQMRSEARNHRETGDDQFTQVFE
jgi:hypothetical protein